MAPVSSLAELWALPRDEGLKVAAEMVNQSILYQMLTDDIMTCVPEALNFIKEIDFPEVNGMLPGVMKDENGKFVRTPEAEAAVVIACQINVQLVGDLAKFTEYAVIIFFFKFSFFFNNNIWRFNMNGY